MTAGATELCEDLRLGAWLPVATDCCQCRALCELELRRLRRSDDDVSEARIFESARCQPAVAPSVLSRSVSARGEATCEVLACGGGGCGEGGIGASMRSEVTVCTKSSSDT